MEPEKDREKGLLLAVYRLTLAVVFLMLVIVCLIYVIVNGVPDLSFKAPLRETSSQTKPQVNPLTITDLWKAPDTATIPHDEKGNLVRYGRELIANTAFYFGPKGTLGHNSSGMNCQNCHLDAGTRPFAYNYSGVSTMYPKFMKRSGKVSSVARRINDCFERSLNGVAIDTMSKEMNAIKAYVLWVGQNVKKGTEPKGYGYEKLAYLDRPADAANGRKVFKTYCVSCHGADGAGKMNDNGLVYETPPVWGNKSYNNGASFFWLTRFAGFVKANMPNKQATYDNPVLTDEEAWDVAAFVDSQTRGDKDVSHDWPDLKNKPDDYPRGPYADEFDQHQHKYGPFAPIVDAKKKITGTK